MIMVETRETTAPGGVFVEADLEVCTGCILLLANGDDMFGVADGMVATWGDDTRHLVPGGDELGYSTSACDGCGDDLHGDRFTAHLLRPVAS